MQRRTDDGPLASGLQSDARLAAKGLRYNPAGLRDGDEELIRYFDWLAGCYEP